VEPYYRDEASGITIYCGDCEDVLPTLPAGSVDLVVTSPPYNLGNTTGGGVKGLGHYRQTDGMQRRGGARTRGWAKPAIADGYADYDDSMPHAEYVAWQHAVLRLLWSLLGDTGAIYYNHKPRILGGRLIPAMSYIPPELLDQVRQEIIWARAGGINHTEAFYCNTHERIVVVARDRFRLTGKAAIKEQRGAAMLAAYAVLAALPATLKRPPFPAGTRVLVEALVRRDPLWSARRLDDDNFIRGLKGAIDGLTDAGSGRTIGNCAGGGLSGTRPSRCGAGCCCC
jgi:DNA modification methylase